MATSAPFRSGFAVPSDDTSATYAHPPVVETWLMINFGAQAKSLMTNSDGLAELLGPEWHGSWTEYAASGLPGGLQLTNVMGDRALRLTDSGLAYGWLGHNGERYPRYESVRDGFVAVFDAVRTLDGLKGVEPKRWSVRYANRIPRWTVWQSSEDWGFFRLWQPAAIKALGIEPAGSNAVWKLPLEIDGATLSIEFRHVVSSSIDETDCVWIHLMAAGLIHDGETGLFDGLDYGREVIVRGFNDLVSDDAKSFWGVAQRK